MSKAWGKHEDWRAETPGAFQVLVGRSNLIDRVVGDGRPWTIDEYVGMMRRMYREGGVDCPVWLCREFVEYLIPNEYIREAGAGGSPPNSRGGAANDRSPPARQGQANRRGPQGNSSSYGWGRGRT